MQEEGVEEVEEVAVVATCLAEVAGEGSVVAEEEAC